jgi:hypothetical protein
MQHVPLARRQTQLFELRAALQSVPWLCAVEALKLSWAQEV